MLSFLLEVTHHKFEGPFCGGRDKILLFGGTLKFVVIIEKFAFKLLIGKIQRKFEKNANFPDYFHVLSAMWEK